MSEINERVARLEERSETTDKRINSLEVDMREVREKINAISIKWTVLMTAGATVGSSVISFAIKLFANKIHLS